MSEAIELQVPLAHVIGLSALLFAIGAFGVLVRRNLLVILMSIELMLAAVALAFVGFNRFWPGGHSGTEIVALDGQVFAILISVVAAAEAAVGVAIIVAVLRARDSIDVDEMSLLRW